MKTIIPFVISPLYPVLLTLALFAGFNSNLSAQSILWKSDMQAASVLAKQQNKLVLLHFTADWCHPCKSLETFVFADPQVQRSFAANVVAVKIDVDEQPDLVKQYGVAGVPFDVALTPAGRIVSKRSSPRDARVYNDMLQGFNVTIQALAGGENVALNQNLNELKDKLYADNNVVERKSFTPSGPSHQVTKPSFNSQELNRNFHDSAIQNPFAQATADAKLVMPPAELPQQDDANTAVDAPKTAAFVASAMPKRILNDRFYRDELNTAENTAEEVKAETSATQVAHAEPTIVKSKATGQLIEKSKFALHGKCPVTLLKEGRWVEGKEEWGCVHRQQTYLFASQAMLNEFQSDPDAFSPLLAGYDPVVFDRSGEFVAGEEEHGVFMGKIPNQRVVLFKDAETRAEFQADPKKYIETIRQAMDSSGGGSSNILR